MRAAYFSVAVFFVTFIGAKESTSYTGKDYSCDPSVCDDVPDLDCMCARLNPPGGLSPDDVPQFVILTADDDVTSVTHPPMVAITKGHTNPDGCPIPTVYYVSIRYTEMDLVNQLYKDGNEIADHTVGHKGFPSEEQINLARKDIAEYTDIPQESIVGFRAPFLKSKPATRRHLYENGFTYDSSITEQAGDGILTEASMRQKLWPYTMDFGIAQNCQTAGDTKCNELERYPGLWEIPMLDLQNEYGASIASMDPVNGNAFDLYMRDFQRSYTGDKAPFGMYIHPSWLLAEKSRIEGVNRFFSNITALDDVWVVTNQEIIEYMRKPMKKEEYRAMRESRACGRSSFVSKAVPHKLKLTAF